jgi:hypothetical protein
MKTTLRSGATIAACLLLSSVVTACATSNAPSAAVKMAETAREGLIKAVTELDTRYPTGSIHSLEAANAADNASRDGEDALADWYGRAQKACYERFFVTNCLDDLKLRRREFKTVLQRVKVEAGAFQRKYHTEELDQAQAERDEKQRSKLQKTEQPGQSADQPKSP